MLLSRPEILKHLKKGTIVIEKFNPKNLKTTSYDVCLGEYYWRQTQPFGRATLHNIYDEKSTKFVWSGPHKAEKVKDLRKRLDIPELVGVDDEDKVIMLAPGETILGHTEEFIGGREVCVAKMYGRSSTGRNFIEVCKDAGWGDVGYVNRWTMEITNNSHYFTIPLVVGRRIAQMVFYEVAPLDKGADYALEKGKYQHTDNLKELMRTWSPVQLIPRMHLDPEAQAVEERRNAARKTKASKKS
jgi:dCTP deaminase